MNRRPGHESGITLILVMIMPGWQKAYVLLQNVGRAGQQVLDPAEPLHSGKEGKLLKLIPGVFPPANMALSPDGKLLYAINVGKGDFGDMAGQVLVIDTATD